MRNDRMQVDSKQTFFPYTSNIPFYLRKICTLLLMIIFPWRSIWQLKRSLKEMRDLTTLKTEQWVTANKRCDVLRDQVNLLKNNIARLSLQDIYLRNDRDTEEIVKHNEAWSKVSVNEISGMLNWPEILDDTEIMNGFGEMIRLLLLFSKESNSINNPSNCWVLLAAKNCDQLLEYGYNNFKRTIGHNYFNFLIRQGDAQIKAVESLFSEDTINTCKQVAKSIPHDPLFCIEEQFSYNYFVLLLWEYVKKIDQCNYLAKIDEPHLGNPILVHANEKSMSQDLANSLIEYYSIAEIVPFAHTNKILEIGGGYGRNAYVILSLNPHAKIFLVDILPALYIAQRYLSTLFKDRKIFKATYFETFAEVQNEIENASIVFLLPHQLTLIPDKYFDLSINISSFGEMNKQQIEWYFGQIDRLTNKYFYMKQWDVSKNPFDGLVLNKNDYPYMKNWQEMYSRNCKIQTEFFETLYQVNQHDTH